MSASESDAAGTVTLTEQLGGDFGLTVVYKFGEYRKVSVSFFAARVVSLKDGNKPTYTRKGATESWDDVEDVQLAERYIAGSVKWDGCSHVWFGDDGAYLHLCGRTAFTELMMALDVIYERCGALMKEHGGYLLDGEFAVEREKAESITPSAEGGDDVGNAVR